jgi:hypothetical protein
MSSGSQNVDGSGERAAPTSPEGKQSLWVLEKADNLLGEIGAAMWLSVASVWRVPRAAVGRSSMDRLKALVVRRQALPPRLSLLVASIASVLLLAVLLPEGTAHISTDTLLSWLATTSPENWLVAGAPALISLWLTVIVLGRVVRLVAGAISDDATGVLMQVTSGVMILSCLGILAVGLGEARLNAVRDRLPDVLIITGFWLMMTLLVVAGARCAQQMMSLGCSLWRRAVLFAVVPLAFVSSVLITLVATYWLLQAQALGARLMDEGKPPTGPTTFSPTCYGMAGSAVCQVLLSARSDLAIGVIRQVDSEWRDLQRSGGFTKVSLLREASQIVQLAPRAEPGAFWILHAKEPLPFAFQIATPDACRLYQQIAAFKHRVRPIPGLQPRPLEVRFTIYWQPGFGLVPRRDASVSIEAGTDEFSDPQFETTLARLCDEEPAPQSRPSGRK